MKPDKKARAAIVDLALGAQPPHNPAIVTESTVLKIPSFNVEVWSLSQVHRYKNNPRANEAAIGKVAASIRAFGWRQPIVVDEAGVIIAGDTRFLAAQLLKLTHVPVHVAEGLSPAKVRAYRLADNRAGQEAEWDNERLLAELRALQDDGVPLESTGFEDAELDELLGTGRGLQPHADPEDVPPLPKVPTAKLGDLFALGNHRVLCGDATTSVAWQRLLGAEPADMLWTDPPYDVDYTGKTKAAMKIKNDALGLALIHLRPGGPMYVCAPHGPQFFPFAKVGTELGWWRQTICWIKDSFAFGRSDFHYRHEAILVGEANGLAQVGDTAMPFADEPVDVEVIGYGWAPGDAHPWYGGRKQDTGWECDRPRVSDEHLTAKPVELVDRAVKASSRSGDVVVDCFAGGGSLLMACEMGGRRARCLELDPAYVDVIITRWENATGRKAEKLEAAV